MNRNDQEYLNKIKEASESVNVPKSLKPEEIEKMLKSKPKKFVWKRIYSAALAACILLVCGVGYSVAREGAYGRDGISGTLDPGSGLTAEGAGGTGLETAKSYADIYQYVKADLDEINSYREDGEIMMEYSMDDGVFSAGAAKSEAAQEISTMDADMAAEPTASDYSETNVRQEGVDEADIVKTDGRCLYTLRDNGRAVAIVDPGKGEMKPLSEIEPGNAYEIQEFYVSDEKLVLVGRKDDENAKKLANGLYFDKPNTFAAVYDISDPAEPKKAGEVSQSGYYTSSRMSDGYLYLFSRYGIYGYPEIEAKDTDIYIPQINQSLLPEEDIYLPITKRANTYEVISSIDMEKPDQAKESKAIFTSGGELYVSNKNIYWYENWRNQQGDASIRRIAYKDGKLTAEASGMVDGYIHDSFCIDEYKDYLRVITTDEDANHVFVLDKDLEVVGSIRGLAKDERVYSARLMGDVGYFVTYRETDPLFSVDFSDPKKPEIIGELKIPGFSEYLHAYGEGKLLGIGMDMDEEGFSTNGVKLSMFDIRDNTDVREVQKYVMENVYSAGALYDYKAVLIDMEKNIIGFSADTGDGERYYVFTYDEREGFRCLMDESVNGNTYQPARGVYIDMVLYVVKGNIIESYSMENYEKIDDLIL